MSRRSTGQVVERKTKRGVVFALRFYAAGARRYETLGTADEGWNRRGAEDELASVMAAVRAGTWQPRRVDQSPATVREVPTFHEFASEWFEANRHGWAERTVKDYRWALSDHLLPFFQHHRLDEITVEEVDGYRAAKLREGKLAPAQINKTLKRLSQILEIAEEYDYIARNPARSKRRRVKAPKVQRSWVEPEQALALIECASRRTRPFVATLTGAGLRVSELVALDWPDVSLATGTVRVGRAKTDAGSYREVDLPGGLVDELTEWKMRSAPELARWMAENPEGGEPVFLSKHRGIRRQSAANVARRLKTAIRAANHRLAELGIEPISERVTPHSLRRAYASLRAASGDDPVYIAEQLGHTDPRFTLSVYTKAVKRRAKLSGVYLGEFDRALAWAALPRAEDAPTTSETRLEASRDTKWLDRLPSDLA
jgi:integrase